MSYMKIPLTSLKNRDDFVRNLRDFLLQYQHGVAEAKKTITLFYRLIVYA